MIICVHLSVKNVAETVLGELNRLCYVTYVCQKAGLESMRVCQLARSAMAG